MAPRNSSPSRLAAPPALCGARPASGGEDYICNFCPRGFRSGNGLAGHYNKHKDVEHDLWIMLGPKGSKIRKDIIQARYEGKTYEYKKRVWPARGKGKGKGKGKARARTPEPIRATQLQSASPGPEARVVGQVVRVQGRGGLLVVKNQRADFFLNNPRARLQEAGPAAKIPGPGGLLVRRDFVALSDGVSKMGPVVWGQEPGVASSSNGGAGVADPPEGYGPGLVESKFPASRLIRSVGKEIIIID